MTTIDELIEKLNTYVEAINGERELRVGLFMCALAMSESASTLTSLQERNRKLEERVAQLTDWLMEVAPSRVSQEAIDMVSADSAMRSLNDARSGAGE